MTLKRIQIGERMSQTVVHGNTVYTAGQVALERLAPTLQNRPAISSLE